MRILHITPHPEARNGISEYATSFARAMTEHEGTSIERLYFAEGTCSSREIGGRLSTIDLGRFDVVHGEIGVGTNSVLYAMAHLARRRRSGMLVTLHDPPLFVFSPTVDLFKYKVNGVLNKAARKLVTDPLYNVTYLPRLASRIGRCMVLNRGAVAPTSRRFPGLDVRYAPLMASGRSRLPATGAPTEVLFYGFVAQAKGLELLIRAAHELQQQGIAIRLHVIGGCLDPAYQRSLMDLASGLSVERAIVWHGFVDDARLDRTLGLGGMVVMPYRETKTLGGSAAVVRAMEQGLPVILSDIRRFTGEYVDGEDALMFREGDVNALVTRMRAVITDAQLRGQLTEASRRRIERVHDPRIVAGAFRALYDNIA